MEFALNLDAEPVTAAHPVEPLVVEQTSTIRETLALLKAQRTGSVVICHEGKLVGIFTERDALRLMASGASLERPISAVMTPNPVVVSANETVGAAIEKMSLGGYRRLPILDAAGSPQGVVKVSGIVRYLAEHFPQSIYNLPPEPNPVMQEREGA